jgi:hypothetical protein
VHTPLSFYFLLAFGGGIYYASVNCGSTAGLPESLQIKKGAKDEDERADDEVQME